MPHRLPTFAMSARKEIMSMRLRELYDRILSEGLDQVPLNPDRLAGRVWAALNNQLSYAVQSRVDTPPKLPADEAKRVLTEASVYAAAKLAEVEARAHFVHDIHGQES
jgi:hypothetical protein